MPLVLTTPYHGPDNSYITEVLADSPWAFWTMDDLGSPPSQATDISGNGRHLTSVSGTPQGGQTKLVEHNDDGFSTSWSGATNTGFNSTTNLLPSLTFPFTVEAWAKMQAQSDIIATHNPSSVYYGAYVVAYSTGVDVSMGDGTGIDGTDRRTYRSDPVDMTYGTTHHIVVRFNQMNPTGGSPETAVELFVDSARYAMYLLSGSATSFNVSSGVLSLGRQWANNTHSANGLLDVIAFYTHSLSESRITQHYQVGSGLV